MKKLELETELINSLLDLFDKRALSGNYKGKTYIHFQHEFILGAVAVIDLINNNNESCIRPILWFSIIRGDKIKKIEL